MSTTKNKGGRPPNPTPKWNPEKERWEVRMSIPDQGRRLRVIPELGPRDEERAKRIVKLMVKRAAVDGYVPDEIGLTVNDWCDTWLEDRELRKIKTVGHDKGRLAHHVLPTIGTLAMSQVTREDIERVVEALDAKIRLDDDDDEHIEWKTASNVWTVVTTMFKDAMSAKNRELRVRKDNPCTGVRGPERGEPKAKQFLFPSEFLKLISCRRIGRRYRQLYAVAVYVLARGGEIEALTWDDVDLEHRVISITKAVDKGTRIVTSTKSKVSRRVPIEPNLLPLLQALYEERDTSEDADRTVMWMPNHDERAIKLREHLKRAKVERADLHLNDARHKHLTFHDLRATGIT
ncbi:MAG: tyrosine-type recombinase/integrase, partial [Polyangiaceae bacterium]